MSENIKQVIILRKDLNMRKGKMVAQGSHASMAVFFNMMKNPETGEISEDNGQFCYKFFNKNSVMHEWIMKKFTKICVSVNSETELIEIYEKAKALGLPCSLIQDAGLTEFKEPTYTAVAIGPCLSNEVNPLTGHLSLL